MMPWKTWLVRLGVAGALVIVAGCGSGDVPDPSSDSNAAEIPTGDMGGPVAAPTPAPAPEQAPVAEAPVAANEEPAAKPEEPKSEEAPAQAPPASESTPDKPSATAEMLAEATKGQQGGGSNPPAGEGTQGGGPGPGGPGGGGMAEMQRRMQGGPGGPGGPGGMGMGMMGPGAPGAGGQNPGDMAKMQQQMQAGMQSQMRNQIQQNQAMRNQMGAGGPGGPGMAGRLGGPGGGGGAASKEPDFHDPRKAVQAFLDAAKDKDLDALTEATSIHAQIDASSARNRDIFKRIVDGSLSEAELDDIASKLDGFKIVSENPPKSSGRIDIIIGKTEKAQNNARITRKITVRHQKGGWKVMDISGPAVYKNPAITRPGKTTYKSNNPN